MNELRKRAEQEEQAEQEEKIEYHYGFYGAVHIEYDKEGSGLTFLQEHELGDSPVRLDMLIINNSGANKLTDPIGKFFRKYNVLEYKSPDDNLSVDDFYKAQAYACLYKGMGRKVNEIPADTLTVSIFRHSYPAKMFSELKRLGLKIEEACPGIYIVTGAVCIPAQVIVMSRLSVSGYEAFKILVKKAEREDVRTFLNNAPNNEYKEAVLRVSVALNSLLYETLKGDSDAMDVLRNLFKDDFAAKLDEGIAIGRDEGIAIGRNEGIAIGRDEGIAIGRDEGRAKVRQDVIATLISDGWSQEEAENLMNRVALRNA